MDVVETLTGRKGDFVAGDTYTDLRSMPQMKTIVIGCWDSPDDPSAVLGLTVWRGRPATQGSEGEPPWNGRLARLDPAGAGQGGPPL